MLDLTSIKVLKAMSTHPGRLPSINVYDPEMVAEWCNTKDEEGIERTLQHLCKQGYVDTFGEQGYVCGYVLAHMGLHYKEFIRLEIWEFVAKSILIPILVALATAKLAS